MKGFDILLNRIKEQPTKVTLKLRYLALVADLESVEEKIATVLRLAEFYRKGFPKEALEMAYLICRYDNANIPAIEIIIEVLQLQGKETQAKLMSEYLSKIRRNLEVSKSDILKQIKYAAGEPLSDQKVASNENPTEVARSVWGNSEETENVVNASNDPNPINNKKENLKQNGLDNETASQNLQSISDAVDNSSDDAATLIVPSSDRKKMDHNKSGNFGSDNTKTELIHLPITEVISSSKHSLKDQESEGPRSNKNSLSLDNLSFENLDRSSHLEIASQAISLSVSHEEASATRTVYSIAKDKLEGQIPSDSSDKTSTLLSSLSLPADNFGISDDKKLPLLKKKGFGGLEIDLDDFLGKADNNQNTGEIVATLKETEIFLNLKENIVPSNQLNKAEIRLSERTSQVSGSTINDRPTSQNSMNKSENVHINPEEKTEIHISPLNKKADNFPLEINPFDGKLPAKFHTQENSNKENKESIKLVLGKGLASFNAGSEEPYNLTENSDSLKDSSTYQEQQPRLASGIDSDDQRSPLHAKKQPLPDIPFDQQSDQTHDSQAHVVNSIVSPTQSQFTKDVTSDNLANRDYKESLLGRQEISQLVEVEENQADTFAFTANEIPQLSGNKIFANYHSGSDHDPVILKLQHKNGMNDLETEESLGKNSTSDQEHFFNASSSEIEKNLGNQHSLRGDDPQSLDLSKRLEDFLSAKRYRDALEMLRNTAEKFSTSNWWKKGFETIEKSGLLGSNGPSQGRNLRSHEVQTLAFRLLEATKNLLAPHEYLREFFMKTTSEVDREKIFDFFFYEPLPGMELLQIDVYMALGASLEAAQLVRDRLQENFEDVDGLVRRARMIWHSLGWQPFVWRPEDGEKKLLAILSQRPRQRPAADLL